MVAQPTRLSTAAAVLGAISILSFAAACDKVPLLAPTGTVITLFPTAPSVPLNGQIEIVATVIENGVTASAPTTPGTPGTPHDAYSYDERRGRNAGTKWHSGLFYDHDRADRAGRGEDEQRSGARPVHLRRPERDGDDYRVFGRVVREAGEPESRQRGGRARHHQRDAADTPPEWRHRDDRGACRGCRRVQACLAFRSCSRLIPPFCRVLPPRPTKPEPRGLRR